MLEIAAELEGLQVGERGNTLDGGDFPILRYPNSGDLLGLRFRNAAVFVLVELLYQKGGKSGSGISTYSSSKEPPGFPLSSPVPVPPAGSEHPASQRHDEANNSQMLLFICSIGFKVKKYDSQETFPAGEFRPEKS